MTLRSLEEHNAVRHADYDVEQAHLVLGKPIGVACPADNCTGELHCPPPFAEFEPAEEGQPPRVATVCSECEYEGYAYA